jgi:hypothetical protein
VIILLFIFQGKGRGLNRQLSRIWVFHVDYIGILTEPVIAELFEVVRLIVPTLCDVSDRFEDKNLLKFTCATSSDRVWVRFIEAAV